MRTIQKYRLRQLDYQNIDMPKGASILSVQFQRGVITLWASVDPDEKTEMHMVIRIHGTGDRANLGTMHPNDYIGTLQRDVQDENGDLTEYHIFAYELSV